MKKMCEYPRVLRRVSRRTIAGSREKVADTLVVVNVCAAAVVHFCHGNISSTGQEAGLELSDVACLTW